MVRVVGFAVVEQVNPPVQVQLRKLKPDGILHAAIAVEPNVVL
jgi:hypothetical protein